MLPLTDHLITILNRRYEAKQNDYVFPARYNPDKHLTTPTKAIYLVQDISGCEVTLHDLRRTFISIAESLDFSKYTLKKLVNHSMEDDVTAGYIVWDVERIREPMQKITDYILTLAELKPSAEIITLPMRQAR